MNAGNYIEERDENRNERKNTQDEIPSLSTQEKLALSSWGLPEKVLQHYNQKGITHMFHWQLECLTASKVLEGGNLVYSAPTSAGKTLVAEILIAQTVFERQKKVILILPFVSVVREKMFYFQNLFSSNGIRVEGFMGGHSPSTSFKQVHVAVCTIEKANSIINRLLEEKNLSSLGLVVVDELHLLGDPYRGYLLELLLTKLKYMSTKLQTNIQIVGMSATLPNLKIIADWLNASVYYSSYRPVPLSETLKCGRCFYDKKLNKLKELIPIQSDVSDLPDHIGQLTLETIKNGHSVLIFCPSKAWCENLADEIALFFKSHGFSKSAEVEGTPGWIVRNQLNLEKISQVIEHLKMTPVGIDNSLHRTVSFGVAFHHAGLTLDERDVIEGSFRNGSIRVLCATSTLSSGVNLPARKVIIRSPMAFGSVMDVLTYRQMIGRAGRMGVDCEGESILICQPNEKNISHQLMASNLKPIQSCLGRGTLSSSLKRALLEIVASGVASTPKEVQEYAHCTFLAFSSKCNIENPIDSCIKFLEENEFIRLQDNGNLYVATPLGRACLASSMPPDEGLSLFRELQRARRCFVLDTDLHIIYQVTPYTVSEQWSKLDWLHVLNVLENLPESMKRVGELVGIEEQFLVRIAKGSLNPDSTENRIKLSIHRRFYTALALQDLVNEVPLTEVAEKFQCNKGTLQSLQQSAATYAGMVTEFTRKLGWGSVELIFSQFQERLQFGVQRDLCELMRLSLLNVVRARALFNAGYTNLASIASASASDLENVLLSTVPFQTKKVIDGETSFERKERNKLQTIWITGRADISVFKAAELLIEQARNVLELELGVEGAQWSNRSNEFHSAEQSVDVEGSKPQDAYLKLESQNNSYDSELCELVPSEMIKSENIFEKNSCTLVQENAINEQNRNNSINKSWILKSEEWNELSMKYDNDLIASQNDISKCEALGVNSSQIMSTSIEKFFESKSLVEKSIEDKTVNLNFSKIKSNNMDSHNISVQKQLDTEKHEVESFAVSFNADSVLNFSEDMVTDRLTETIIQKPQGDSNGQVNESDTCSTTSESSVEMLRETSKISEVHETERLSGDMFDIHENEPDDNAVVETKAASLQGNERETVDIAGDLFSQTLTFDTQLHRITDGNETDFNKPEKLVIARSLSFNSDDLGFVSDFSPPKLKKAETKESLKDTEKKPDLVWAERITQIGDFKGPKFTSSPLDIKSELEELPNKSQCRSLKRKTCVSNSPDFIIGSDDSLVEDGHANKKFKAEIPGNTSDNGESSSFKNLDFFSVKEESDTEIMPTPKFNRVASINSTRRVSNKSLINRKKTLLHIKNITGKRSILEQKIATTEKNSVDTKMKNGIVVPKCSSAGERNNGGFISRNANNLSTKVTWDKISIIDVSADDEVESFAEELKLQNIIGLAVGCRRVVRERKSSIGMRIMRKKIENTGDIMKEETFMFKDMILDGIAMYFRGNSVFYLSFNTNHNSASKIAHLKAISGQNKLFRMFDAKEQIKLLHHLIAVTLEGLYEDPKTAHWLLSRTWKEKSFSSVVIDLIPESTKLTSQLGPMLGCSAPGLYTKSSVPARTRASIEAFLSFHAMERQLKLLRGKLLLKVFRDVEMPLVLCLAESELIGFQFDRKKLMNIKNMLDSVQSELVEKAYSFAGYKFSLSSSAAISKLLFNDLKLGKSDSFLTKKNQRPSTKKEALEELAVETNHPLPDLILSWRKIQSVLSKVLSPLLQIDPEISRLFSTTLMHTVTGRLSMHEPNLQNMPRNFSVNIGRNEYDVSVREIFVASEGCTLMSVDYCQIELRFLAHLSGDEKLIKNIKNSSDVFANIASRIFDVRECNVDDELRQKAKKTCYGIIYGIGPSALSHQLRVEESVALALMEDFKNKYKGVNKYLDNTLKECRKKGYVTSLLGRRRYLPYINDPNPIIKHEAERQAINTTIQGSAADLLKMAMVRIRKKIKDLKEENIILNLILHMHDELLFEVGYDYLETVATIVKETMESVISLKVPTPVKFHTGPSWGQLCLYEV